MLPSRVIDYRPAMLDELVASGEVVWSGHGALGSSDGWIALHPADLAPLTVGEPGALDATAVHEEILDRLAAGGAYQFRQLYVRAPRRPQPPRPPTRTSNAPCGTWCGRVASATTPSHRSGPCSPADRPDRAAPRHTASAPDHLVCAPTA